jgi:four helix bundle protein
VGDRPREITDRTFEYALEVARLCRERQRRDDVARTLARQFLRVGTSIGANVEGAQAGESRADFVSKYSIALKETREARHWLRLLLASGDCPVGPGESALLEAEELQRIIAAIVVKAKQNAPRRRGAT